MNLQQMITELNNSIYAPNKSKVAYNNYINAIVRRGAPVNDWLNNIIINGPRPSLTPEQDALDRFNNYFNGSTLSNNTIGNYQTAYNHLTRAVLGLFYANVWSFYNKGLPNRISICELVSKNALFASGQVVSDVMAGKAGAKNNIGKGNNYASWDNCSHARVNGVKKGTSVFINGSQIIADDNTIANQAIKKAILLSRGYARIHNFRQFKDYQACHIWDNPQNPRFYASIANLVLVPSAFAGLTDYCQPIKDLLRFRAWDLFHNTGVTLPCGTNVPLQPRNYNRIIWRV